MFPCQGGTGIAHIERAMNKIDLKTKFVFHSSCANIILFVFVVSLASISARGELLEPSRPLPPGAFARTQEPQRLQIIESGLASFGQRLKLIESAQKSIDAEYFIYKADTAGRLYTQALLKKAAQGVKVRILIDDTALNNENLNIYHAHVLGEKGIEVRYYNDSSLIEFKKANHRSHRKSLIVDGQQAMIGGRNVADEYFDMAEDFNFLDRDVLVRGSIVRDIQQSFENFWTSRLSKPSGVRQPPHWTDYGLLSPDEGGLAADKASRMDQYKRDLKAYQKGLAAARRFLEPEPQDTAILGRISQWLAPLLSLAPEGTCTETYFYADLPGTSDRSRVVLDQVKILTGTAQKSLLVESPYFIQREPENLFLRSLQRGVQIQILTNSLRSTDEPLSIAPFFATAKNLSSLGAEVFVLEGDQPRWLEFSLRLAKAARWGTHAKSFVIDEDALMIGSYNQDPRSENFNAEMALVCRGNQSLASGLRLDLQRRKSIAVKLNASGEPVTGQGKYFNTTEHQRFVYHLLKPLSYLLEPLL